MKHECPVCAFTGLLRPPDDYTICPCCGTEFGNDDLFSTPEELREQWVASGARWWSMTTSRPPGWSAVRQLEAAGFPNLALRLQERRVTVRLPGLAGPQVVSTSVAALVGGRLSARTAPVPGLAAHVSARSDADLANAPILARAV